MLDVGFSELIVFAIIALLILGPEKLPEAARFAAKWYGKFKRLISKLQNEMDRELHLSEFREEMNAEINRISELERRLQQKVDDLIKGDLKQNNAHIQTQLASFNYIFVNIENNSVPFIANFRPTCHQWQNTSILSPIPTLKFAV